MKTPEDEAFDELAKKQGDWGGGFPAKRKMAADKVQEHWRDYFVNCKHCGKEKLIQRGNHHPWCACLSDEFDWDNQRLAQPAQEPLTLDELEILWNAQADPMNQWDELGLDEIVAFAQEAAHNIGATK